MAAGEETGIDLSNLCAVLRIENATEEYDSPIDLTLVTCASGVGQAVVVELLRAYVRYCYAEPEYAQRQVDAGAHENAEAFYQAEKLPTIDRIRLGDFGEAVAQPLLSDLLFDFEIPLIRLRYKSDPDGSPQGLDLLGFAFLEIHGRDELCIAEVKAGAANTAARTSLRRACSQLVGYGRAKEIRSIGQIGHQLFVEKRLEESDRLVRFKDGRGQVAFSRRKVAVCVLDESTDPSHLTRLLRNAALGLGGSLTAVVVRFLDIDALVEHVYAERDDDTA